LALKRLRNVDASSLGRDALAGFISAVGGIAYCISLSALIFQGGIVGGFALGLAAHYGYGGHVPRRRADLDFVARRRGA
jgi:hypothetical protein